MADILIVDDHPDNRLFLVELLRYHNHQLFEAQDGAEALAVVREKHPDLVITDILMPTMDGYEFVRQLRADPAISATAVIFFTAHYHREDAQALARHYNVARILMKPCDPETILQVVDEWLAMDRGAVQPESPDGIELDHLRIITDKLSQTSDELENTNQRLAALIDLNLQLASERDPGVLLGNVCRAARDLFSARYAMLAVCGKENLNDVHSVTAGIDAERNGPMKLDSAVSEIFIGFQAASLAAACSKYTASGVRRSSAL